MNSTYDVTNLGAQVEPKSVNRHGDVLVVTADGNYAVYHDGTTTALALPSNVCRPVGRITDQRWVLVQSEVFPSGYARFDYKYAAAHPAAGWSSAVLIPCALPSPLPVTAVSRTGLVLSAYLQTHGPATVYVTNPELQTSMSYTWAQSVDARAVNDQGVVLGTVWDTVGLGQWVVGASGLARQVPGAIGDNGLWAVDLLCNDGVAGIRPYDVYLGTPDSPQFAHRYMEAMVNLQDLATVEQVEPFIERNDRGTRINAPGDRIVINGSKVAVDDLFPKGSAWSGSVAAALSDVDHVAGSGTPGGERCGFLLTPSAVSVEVDLPEFAPLEVFFGVFNDGPGYGVNLRTGRKVPVPPRWYREALEQLSTAQRERVDAAVKRCDPSSADGLNSLRLDLIDVLYGSGRD